MRILVLQPAAGDDLVGGDQRLDDDVIGIAVLALVVHHAVAGEQRHMVVIAPVRADGVRHLAELFRHEEIEVVGAVARRQMDEAGAGVVGDEVARHHRHREVEIVPLAPSTPRSGCAQTRCVGSTSARRSKRGDARRLEHVGGELVGEDEMLADLGPIVVRRLGHLIDAIGDVRREGDGAVAGDGPGRRRPDDDGGALIGREQMDVVGGFRRLEAGGIAAMGRIALAIAGDRELHEDRGRGVVVILDLGLGQRGALHHRPHHRLGAAIEQAVGGELHDLAGDLRLGIEAHGGIGMRPVALDAEPLELLALDVEPVLGEDPAFLAEFDDRHLVLVAALGAVLLLDLPFDRQAVAVPAGDVVGIMAERALGAHHDVLQDLVERVADMDVAVGIGRAVMQHEAGAAGARLALLLVEVDPRPARQ